MGRKKHARQLLTLRQRVFVREVLSGTAKGEAARRAGYKATSSDLVNSPTIKRAIEEALDKHGLSDGYAVAKLRELCEASNTYSDGRSVPNWSARAKGLHILFSLKNAYQQKDPGDGVRFEERLMMLTTSEEEAIDV